MKPQITRTLLMLVLLLALQLAAFAQGTVFTYQGTLATGGNAASGNYDFAFALWNAKTGGAQQAATFATNAVPVKDGSFLVTLDFGAAFSGSPLWLEIDVRTNGPGPFTTLSPRQALTPVPYALFAPNAGSASSVAPNSVTVAGIQNAAITALKIAPGQVVKSFNGLADNVALAAGANVSLTTNANTLTISAAGGTASGGWSTSGNAGTTPTANFLGTTDGQALVLKAGGVGVNTNNPQAALHVNGTVLATGFAGDGSGLTNLSASVSTQFTLNLLAITNNLGAATGVAVSGHYAYLTSHPDGGFLVYDVSDPAHPVRVAQNEDLPASPTAVAISGDYAFVSAGSLCTVDISSPANPVIVYQGGNNYYTWGIAVSGQLACLAADTDGLFLYNISDPTKPALLAQIQEQNGGAANDVAISGNVVYLANENDGLRIYNVANPAVPVNISHLKDGVANGGSATAIALSGSFAYLANGDDGLRIYNVSNPTNPIPVGYVSEAIPGSGGSANGIAISGRYAFVANFSDGLRVYDVSDPAHPTAVAAAPDATGSFTWAVAVAGNYAYTAEYQGGLATYFAAPLAQVPGVVAATGFIGDGSTLSGLWQLGGNAGTTPGKNFIGTTDNQPLEFSVNNRPALTLGINGALAMGLSAATGAESVALSGGNASGSSSIALGYSDQAANAYAIAMGEATTAGGRVSTSMGGHTVASGDYSIAMGNSTRASGGDSTAMGAFTAATNSCATAMGIDTVAGGFASTALGSNTLASAVCSTAMGIRSTAGGFASTALGSNTLASAVGSTAMGSSTIAAATNSTAMGDHTTASGLDSTASGAGTTASGLASTSLGGATTASGDWSTAMGGGTTASGDYSTAVGALSVADGKASFAGGWRAKALHPGSFVWADSTDQDFSSTANDQFLIRAAGGVAVVGDLQVTGTLQATKGMPSVSWDQQGPAGTTAVSADNVVLASCTNTPPAPGFFVIQASAQVALDNSHFVLTLTGSSDPASLAILTSADAYGIVNLSGWGVALGPPPDVNVISKSTQSLTWVTPTSITGAPMFFHIIGSCTSGTSTVFNRNLTVMYFPKPWDGGAAGKQP